MTDEAAKLAEGVASTTWYWYDDNGDVTWTASDTPNKVARALLDRDREIARLKQEALLTPGRIREHMKEVIEVRRERDDFAVRFNDLKQKYEAAEARLKAAEDALRECGRYFAENNKNDETEAMLEFVRAALGIIGDKET